MRITVTAKTRAKVSSVKQIAPGHFVVAVTEPPIEGKANEAIIDALAGYFDVAPSRCRLVHGASGKKKIVEIN